MAAYESLRDCEVDNVVRTVQFTPQQDAPDSSDGLTVLQFTDKLSLFRPYTLSPLVTDFRKSKLRPTAKTFVPVLSTTVTRAPSPALNEQALMSRGTVETAATLSVEELEAPATTEEVKAAIMIQVACKRALRRRATPLPEDGRVKLWYDRCVDAQECLQGPKAYSKYFLGPLVHVLIWADAVVRLLKNRKDRFKKKFSDKKFDHTQIEDLTERLTVYK